jgi:hypothetical protein
MFKYVDNSSLELRCMIELMGFRYFLVPQNNGQS